MMFSSHWPVLVSKTRQEEKNFASLSRPPQVAIIGRSPAVRKVVWLYCLSGREGGEQLLVAGYTSVDKNLVLLSPSPPVRRSRFASLGEPEDYKSFSLLFFAMICSLCITLLLAIKAIERNSKAQKMRIAGQASGQKSEREKSSYSVSYASKNSLYAQEI